MAILKIFYVFSAFFFPSFLFSFSFSFSKKREKVGEDWRERGKCESSTRVGKYICVGYEILLLDVILLYS